MLSKQQRAVARAVALLRQRDKEMTYEERKELAPLRRDAGAILRRILQ